MDLSPANGTLDQVRANEGMMSNPCSINSPDYIPRGCDVIHNQAQAAVDTATLHRNLGLGAATLGVIAAGAGAYFVFTGGDKYGAAESATSIAARVWSDGRGGGLVLGGRF